jgi:hypothetical protein
MKGKLTFIIDIPVNCENCMAVRWTGNVFRTYDYCSATSDEKEIGDTSGPFPDWCPIEEVKE